MERKEGYKVRSKVKICPNSMISEATMPQLHLRIVGYVITLMLHVTNLTVMQMMKREELSADIKIRVFREMLYRYFTCWTIMLQIIYALLGLYCDLLILKNAKNKKYRTPRFLQGSRDIIFSALVWPCSLVVFTVFWTLFLYDRSLIFPEFIDQIISSISNHILHTAIVPIVLWEVVNRSRVAPKSHLRNIVQLAVHLIVYLCVLYYTYITEGIWLYPIFAVTYGSIHFVLLHVYIGVMALIFYYLQWVLNYVVHGSQEKSKPNLDKIE